MSRSPATPTRSPPAARSFTSRKPLWATEFWWDSNPPDPDGVPQQTQARWLEQALYLFWKQGVKRAVWFQIRDAPPVPDYASTYQTGLFLLDGTPKPAYQAYRFPFVGDRLDRRRIRVWGMAPGPGKVRVQHNPRRLEDVDAPAGGAGSRLHGEAATASRRAATGPRRRGDQPHLAPALAWRRVDLSATGGPTRRKTRTAWERALAKGVW